MRLILWTDSRKENILNKKIMKYYILEFDNESDCLTDAQVPYDLKVFH